MILQIEARPNLRSSGRGQAALLSSPLGSKNERSNQMRTHVSIVVVALCLLVSGCGESRQGDKRFTERMAGSAESVNGIIYAMGGMTLSANLPDVGA